MSKKNIFYILCINILLWGFGFVVLSVYQDNMLLQYQNKMNLNIENSNNRTDEAMHSRLY